MRKLSLKPLIAIISLCSASVAANATTILNNGSAGYYNAGLGTLLDTTGVNDPFPCANVGCGDSTLTFLSAPDLSAAAAPLGTWLTNSAPTGGAWSAAPQAIPGTWSVNTETAVVYEIDAGTGLSNLNLSLGVDNGIFVWLNGSYLFGARAAGGSSLGEYSLALSDLVGVNYLQVLREDHGGGTGYDISLTGDVRTSVPEPASAVLFGLGLLGLGFARRQSAQQKNSVRQNG
jgi:hypothetical protein